MQCDVHHCPGDREETADAYIMGRLGVAETTLFEDHYITCRACAEAVDRTAELVEMLRAGGSSLRSRTMTAKSD